MAAASKFIAAIIEQLAAVAEPAVHRAAAALPSYDEDNDDGYINNSINGSEWVDAQHVCWHKVGPDYKPL